jgi:hypothetical protein
VRPRVVRAQKITVRPIKPSEGDVFGDASAITRDVRGPAIGPLKMQVSYVSGTGPRSGAPGRERDVRAIAIFRTMDVPAGSDWTPRFNDLIELADGQKLFIIDVQPAYPIKASKRNPSGGFAGYRLLLANQDPVLRPSTRND